MGVFVKCFCKMLREKEHKFKVSIVEPYKVEILPEHNMQIWRLRRETLWNVRFSRTKE